MGLYDRQSLSYLKRTPFFAQVTQNTQQQEQNQEKNEANLQTMEQQQRNAENAASPSSGRRLQQSSPSPSPITQQDITNQAGPNRLFSQQQFKRRLQQASPSTP